MKKLKFNDLAWAALIYKASGGDKQYNELYKHSMIIKNLRKNPGIIKSKDFECVKKFLNGWSCHTSKKVTDKLLKCYIKLYPSISQLKNKVLQDLNDNDFEIIHKIQTCFMRKKGIKIAIAGKFLHIINPKIFCPIDNPIIEELIERKECNNKLDYIGALKYAKRLSNEVIEDFIRKKIYSHNKPERYLNDMLEYKRKKTLPKFIDEYFWVTITNNFEIPPKWHPGEELII